jgi:hypothetical protein
MVSGRHMQGESRFQEKTGGQETTRSDMLSFLRQT